MGVYCFVFLIELLVRVTDDILVARESRGDTGLVGLRL